MQPNGSQSPKYLPSGPFQKKVADPSIKVVLSIKGKTCWRAFDLHSIREEEGVSVREKLRESILSESKRCGTEFEPR